MQKPYKRVVLFSGGGTRLALYGGMFEALEEMGLRPDLLIASCGGAFASVVINAFSTHAQRKAFFQSMEYFHFIMNLKLSHYRKLYKMGWFACQKMINPKRAPWIENIFDRYLVEMPQDLAPSFPSLANISFSKTLPTIIVGSKILFNPLGVGQQRGQRKLFQKVLVTDISTARIIPQNGLKLASQNYTQSAVEEEILIKTNLSILEAARLSMSDMFYLSPFKQQQEYFLGGVVDLLPFEVGDCLAQSVILERKQGYTALEEGLIRSVFGFSANARLEEVNAHQAYWIDTRDATLALQGHYPQKKIDWKKFEVCLSLPKSYEQFQEDSEKQWQYGYQKTLKSLQK